MRANSFVSTRLLKVANSRSLRPLSFVSTLEVVGWCDGPGETSSAGASYNLGDSRARAYCACSRCGWGLFGHFFSPLSFLHFLPLSGRRPDID